MINEHNSYSGIFADLVLLNGVILTVDNDFSRAEAVAVRDGKILEVGENKTIKPFIGLNTNVIDLKGKTVLPGFHDAHSHMYMFGAQLSQVNCRSPPIKSIEEIIVKLREKADNTPIDRWIVGWGYDDTKLNEKRHPTRWDLDKASSENPVVVRRTCGHTMVVNSKALELVGYCEKSLQPEGGEIEMDPTSEEPTGILRETAMNPVNDFIRSYTVEEMEETIKLACQQALKEGITSYQEAGLRTVPIKAYQNN